jgi:hypothetical protein
MKNLWQSGIFFSYFFKSWSRSFSTVVSLGISCIYLHEEKRRRAYMISRNSHVFPTFVVAYQSIHYTYVYTAQYTGTKYRPTCSFLTYIRVKIFLILLLYTDQKMGCSSVSHILGNRNGITSVYPYMRKYMTLYPIPLKIFPLFKM